MSETEKNQVAAAGDEKNGAVGKVNAVTGMPEMEEAEINPFKKTVVSQGVIKIVIQLIGLAIALAIYYLGDTDFYDASIKSSKGSYKCEYSWYFLGVVIYCYTVEWLNTMPTWYKEKVMRSGNMRANQFLYRPTVGGDDQVSSVTLYEDGDKGKYNRANRSLYHSLENGFSFIVCLPGAFLVFPFPTFVCLVLLCIGRITYQLGYSVKGFLYHLPGFFTDRFVTYTLIAFHWIIFVKQMTAELTEEEKLLQCFDENEADTTVCYQS